MGGWRRKNVTGMKPRSRAYVPHVPTTHPTAMRNQGKLYIAIQINLILCLKYFIEICKRKNSLNNWSSKLSCNCSYISLEPAKRKGKLYNISTRPRHSTFARPKNQTQLVNQETKMKNMLSIYSREDKRIERIASKCKCVVRIWKMNMPSNAKDWLPEGKEGVD